MSNENENKYVEVLNTMYETYTRKNNDYGDSFSRTYKELGILSAVGQISHKYHRVVTLAKGVEGKVKEESLQDSLLDLANYAIMTLVELESEKKSTGKSQEGLAPKIEVEAVEAQEFIDGLRKALMEGFIDTLGIEEIE